MHNLPFNDVSDDYCMAGADYLPMLILLDNDFGIDLKFGNFK